MHRPAACQARWINSELSGRGCQWQTRRLWETLGHRSHFLRLSSSPLLAKTFSSERGERLALLPTPHFPVHLRQNRHGKHKNSLESDWRMNSVYLEWNEFSQPFEVTASAQGTNLHCAGGPWGSPVLAQYLLRYLITSEKNETNRIILFQLWVAAVRQTWTFPAKHLNIVKIFWLSYSNLFLLTSERHIWNKRRNTHKANREAQCFYEGKSLVFSFACKLRRCSVSQN